MLYAFCEHFSVSCAGNIRPTRTSCPYDSYKCPIFAVNLSRLFLYLDLLVPKLVCATILTVPKRLQVETQVDRNFKSATSLALADANLCGATIVIVPKSLQLKTQVGRDFRSGTFVDLANANLCVANCECTATSFPRLFGID